MRVATWVQGARPKTLLLAIAPVIAGAASVWEPMFRGCAAAANQRSCTPSLSRYIAVTLLCLGVALFLQIAANYVNDYADGVRGTDATRADTEAESGSPQRLTASGKASPKQVMVAAGISAALACGCGLALTILTGHWWFILVGILCLLAGWCYVGGPHPYGYMGLGEIAVFLFFGLVATCGTAYALSSTIPLATLWAAVALALLAVAVLNINNLRDLASDRACGKRTWMVRLGYDYGAPLTKVLVIVPPFMVLTMAITRLGGDLSGVLWQAIALIVLLGIAFELAISVIVMITHQRYRVALPLCSLLSLVVALGFAAAYSL